MHLGDDVVLPYSQSLSALWQPQRAHLWLCKVPINLIPTRATHDIPHASRSLPRASHMTPRCVRCACRQHKARVLYPSMARESGPFLLTGTVTEFPAGCAAAWNQRLRPGSFVYLTPAGVEASAAQGVVVALGEALYVELATFDQPKPTTLILRAFQGNHITL